MKKIVTSVYITVMAITIMASATIACNDSATANKAKDTLSTDTVGHKIVTQGGLQDSIATGATDTTKRKDSTPR
ncbi:MAG: hypothetical protein QM764_21930 [Chitinophagaceae bacterium]